MVAPLNRPWRSQPRRRRRQLTLEESFQGQRDPWASLRHITSNRHEVLRHRAYRKYEDERNRAVELHRLLPQTKPMSDYINVGVSTSRSSPSAATGPHVMNYNNGRVENYHVEFEDCVYLVRFSKWQPGPRHKGRRSRSGRRQPTLYHFNFKKVRRAASPDPDLRSRALRRLMPMSAVRVAFQVVDRAVSRVMRLAASQPQRRPKPEPEIDPDIYDLRPQNLELGFDAAAAEAAVGVFPDDFESRTSTSTLADTLFRPL